MIKSISVIIPVYNAERFLRISAGSILKTRAADFELILSDDGSTDRSGSICDQIASSDGRVKVLHSENSGVSAARNRGLDAAEGVFVLFLDADDEIADGAMDMLLETARREMKSRRCFIGFAYSSRLADGRERAEYFPIKKQFCTDPDTIRRLLFGTPLLNTCWGKLFRLENIRQRGLRFPEQIRIGEDYAFVMQFLSNASDESMCLVNKVAVIYCQNMTGAERTLNLKRHISGLRYIWNLGLEITERPAFSCCRNLFSMQQFATLMYEFRLIVSQCSRKRAICSIEKILKLDFVREMIDYAGCADFVWNRNPELKMAASGKVAAIYSYLKIKIWIRKVLRRE